MAAAAIPLIAGLLPDVINLVTALVHKHAPVAEAAGGTGTGPVKFADVFVAVMKDLVAAKTADGISAIPDDSIVKVIIQAVVNSMQLSGGLGATPKASPAPVAASIKSLVLTPGESVNISVKA